MTEPNEQNWTPFRIFSFYVHKDVPTRDVWDLEIVPRHSSEEDLFRIAKAAPYDLNGEYPEYGCWEEHQGGEPLSAFFERHGMIPSYQLRDPEADFSTDPAAETDAGSEQDHSAKFPANNVVSLFPEP